MTGVKGTPQGIAGFTLMEMLVVMGIFAVVLTAASDIFLASNRAQRKTLSMELVQSDARYAMEAIVREVRSGTIDYSWYAANAPLSGNGLSSALAIVDGQGDRILFYHSLAAEECGHADSCIMVSLNGGIAQPITPKGVSVRRASFYVRPTADPYAFDHLTGLYGSDEQPRATVSLEMDSDSVDPREKVSVFLQTTASTRNFRR